MAPHRPRRRGAAAYGDQIINVLEPATLAKLLSTGDRSSVTPWHKNRTTGRNQRIYTRSGTITLKELYRVSPPSARRRAPRPLARTRSGGNTCTTTAACRTGSSGTSGRPRRPTPSGWGTTGSARCAWPRGSGTGRPRSPSPRPRRHRGEALR
ncbi:hypothetical protein ACFQ0B_56870 [Nonomuraea thailandensis]